MMHPPADGDGPSNEVAGGPAADVGHKTRLVRFDIGERWIHRTFGVLMGICLLTAAMLYIPGVSVLVGQRYLVRTVHLWAGLALPIPLVVGVVASAGFRADISRLNRFSPFDWAWLRPARRRAVMDELASAGRLPASGTYPVGKFNAGQKLNAAFTLGATIVMLVTGTFLVTSQWWPDWTRGGATFVHDWLALAVAVVVVGHLWRAFGDPQARAGMRSGDVGADWAWEHHPVWAEQSQAVVPTRDQHRP